jgi:hypothetical protein
MRLIVEKNKDRVIRFYDRDKVFQTYGDLYRQYISASGAAVAAGQSQDSEAG